MLNSTLPRNNISGTFVSPAEVIEVGQDNLYRVSGEFTTAANGQTNAAWALLSIELENDLSPGDRVLITGESLEACYIIGIIKRQSRLHTQAEISRITASTGAYAETVNDQGKETIQIRDEQQNLIFEYDTDQQRATLSISRGDLRLNAPDGEIQLFSSKGIHCRSLGEVQFESQQEIKLKVPSASAMPVSALQINEHRASLTAQTCDIKATQANLLAEHTKIQGDSLAATLTRSKLVVERLETVAQRVFQRAVNIFCRVENLQQIQAGKVRSMVTEDYYLKAENTDIHAHKDIKINADKIHLG